MGGWVGRWVLKMKLRLTQLATKLELKLNLSLAKTSCTKCEDRIANLRRKIKS